MKKILMLTAIIALVSLNAFAMGGGDKEFPLEVALITDRQGVTVSDNSGSGIEITSIEEMPADTAADEPKKEEAPAPVIKTVRISMNNNSYYLISYKYGKPLDVPQEAYDALWEIQLEVVNNFTYDYEALRDPGKRVTLTTLEDFYKRGKGVCAGYADFFALLAKERGATENLYYVSGSGKGGGHAWIEYRTENNRYIIDPTWSDDYSYRGEETRRKVRESEAYGRSAFFITFEESRKIFSRQGYTHNTFIVKTQTPLWNKKQDDA